MGFSQVSWLSIIGRTYQLDEIRRNYAQSLLLHTASLRNGTLSVLSLLNIPAFIRFTILSRPVMQVS